MKLEYLGSYNETRSIGKARRLSYSIVRFALSVPYFDSDSYGFYEERHKLILSMLGKELVMDLFPFPYIYGP